MTVPQANPPAGQQRRKSNGNTGSSPKNRPSFFTDAVLIAIATALAYAIAFAYEAGFADHFGYPRWLIEVNLLGILIAWGALFATFALVFSFGFIATVIVPLRPLVLIFNHVFFILAGSVFLMALPWIPNTGLPRWGDFLFAGMGVGAFILYLSYFVPFYRRTDPSLGFISRFEQGVNALKEARSQEQPLFRSIGHGIIANPTLGRMVGGTLALLILIGVPLTAAKELGRFHAGLQEIFPVIGVAKDTVLLRRYGDYLIVAPIDRSNGQIKQVFRVVKVEQNLPVFTLENLRGIRIGSSPCPALCPVVFPHASTP